MIRSILKKGIKKMQFFYVSDRIFNSMNIRLLGLFIVFLPFSAFSQSLYVTSGGSVTASNQNVYIAADASVTASSTFSGATISITGGFLSSEDVLGIAGVISGTDGSITYSYNSSTGILTLTGTTTAANYQITLRKVTYKNTNSSPNTTPRTIKVSLSLATPYAGNGHYYEYITSGSAITWSAAKTAAAARIFFGLQGYLATITTAGENSFCMAKLVANAWIGATDEVTEGSWLWGTGPEAGTRFWITPGGAVSGSYGNWATGEPNNGGNPGMNPGEDYAQILNNGTGTWNDSPNSVAGLTGYLVEYGGMASDPVFHISDNVTVSFIEPSVQSSALTFSNVQMNQMTVGWTNGDGTQRMVFAKEGTGTITNPPNGTGYSASANWSSKGTQLGTSGYYCIYNSTGNSVTLTGLVVGTQYTFQVFEYNFWPSSQKYNTNVAIGNPGNQTTAVSNVKVTCTSGTTGPSWYSTLKGAFDAINLGTHQGVITIAINTSTNETASVVLNASSAPSNYSSVNIFPTTDNVTISGTLAAPLIDLNSADNVTIDGRVNQSVAANGLTISNLSTSNTAGTSTIRFINDATANTVKYCSLKGSSTNASAGIVFFSTTSGTSGNDSNTIDHNTITNSADANRPLNAIYSSGTNAKENSNITISSNNIYDFLNRGTASFGIQFSSNTTGCTISGNSFYETASFAPTANVEYRVINITSGITYTVSNNYIGGNTNSCGGTPWTKTIGPSPNYGNTFYALYFSLASGNASNVQGNTIKNFSWTNTGSLSWYGINIAAGNVNIGTTSGNIIGAATGNGSITLTNSVAGNGFYGILGAGSGIINIYNNSIGSITAGNSNTLNSTFLYGINITSTGTVNIVSNTIGSIDAATTNSLYASSASGSLYQHNIGISNSGNCNLTISKNTISKLTNSNTAGTVGTCTGINITSGKNVIINNIIRDLTNANSNTIEASPSVAGIFMGYSVANTMQTISGNTIYNLSNSNTSFAGYIDGLYYSGGTGSPSKVSENFIYGISVTGASSVSSILTGIYIMSGTTVYSNNIINLGIDKKATIYGIKETGLVNNNNSLFYNTVYLSGTIPSGGSNNSYALYSNGSANTRDIRNNIFWNARSTTGASNVHYAAYFDIFANTNLTLDYNDYYASSTGKILGYYNKSNVTALPIVTGMDAHSSNITPSFASAGGTATLNYYPSASLTGASTTGILTDINEYARNGAIPKMGAVESSSAPSNTVSVYKAGILQTSYTNLKNAFDKINDGTHTGSLVLKITASQIMNSAAVLNESGTGSASYTDVTIYPATTGLTISGTLNTPLIDLNGADNVTIDGRVNQTGSKDLTIANNSTAGFSGVSTIRFINGAMNNTVKYCTLKGSATGTSNTTAVVLIGEPSNLTGNSNNLIDNNDITNAGGNRPSSAIVSNSNASGQPNTTNSITNNNIFDYLNLASDSYGLTLIGGSSSCTISGNSLFETTNFAPSGANAIYSIYLSAPTGTNFNISNNSIGGSAPNCAGTYAWRKTNANANVFYGITVSVGTGTTSNVQGNTISNFSYANNTTSQWYGIALAGGDVNIGTTAGNTIGAATGTGSVSITNSIATITFYGIYITSGGISNIGNNTIGAITLTTYAPQPSNFYGIYKNSTAGTTTISNNTIGNTSTGNSVFATTASTLNPQVVYGIYSDGTGTVTVSGNTIANLTNGTTNSTVATPGLINGITVNNGANILTGNIIHDLTIANANNTSWETASVTGISLNVATSGGQTVTGNTIYNLSNTLSTFAGSINGLIYKGTLTTGSVCGNLIYGLSVNSASPGATISGLFGYSGTATYANNIVSLGGNTNSILNGIVEYGDATSNHKFYFNTVYLNGNPTTGSSKSQALHSVFGNHSRDFRNNLFINARSNNGATGKNYAAYIPSGTGSSGFTEDFNDYLVTGNGGILGYFNATDVSTLSGWQTATGQDLHSKNADPQFAVAGGLTELSYLPSEGTLIAVPGTGILNDYAGAIRNLTVPAMGAYDYQVYSIPTITYFSPVSGKTGTIVTISGNALNGATAITFGGTAASSFSIVDATTITAVVNSGSSGSISVATPGGTASLYGFSYYTISDSPTNLVATPGNASGSILFSIPASNGGSPITNYEYSTDNGGSWTPFSPAVTSSPVTITGLTNGITYQVKLRAVNDAGSGTASTTVTVTPVAPCINPTNGGSISSNQTGEAPFDPITFSNTGSSTGHTGTLEYKWQSSTTSGSTGFSDIASSNLPTYDAGALSVTTWFKRLARVSCASDWTGAVESNVLQVNVLILADEPSSQPKDLSFSNTVTSGNTNIVINYSASASASGYLVIRNTGATPTFVPQDGTAYTAGPQGSDQILYVGPATTATDLTITKGTRYFYKIYAFNGSDRSINYLTSNPLTGTTLCSLNNTGALPNNPSLPASLGFPDVGVNLTFPNGTIGTTLNAIRTIGPPPSNLSTPPNVRSVSNLYFTITSTEPSPGTFSIVLDFSGMGKRPDEWDSFNILKRPNSSAPWSSISSIGGTITNRCTDGVYGKFTVTGLNSFSDFALGEMAVTLTVTTGAETGPGSLKQCILDATAGDFINFNLTSMGTNTIKLTSHVVIDKDLTIQGAASGIVLDGNNVTQVMEIIAASGPQPVVRIEKLTITKGNDAANVVGGIKNAGDLLMVNCLVVDNADTGVNGTVGAVGGIYSTGNLTLINTTVSGNAGATGNGGIGGIYLIEPVGTPRTLKLYNSIFYGNTGQFHSIADSKIAESYNSLYEETLDVLKNSNSVSFTQGTPGLDNKFGNNPKFVGKANNATHPYMILGASPCVDGGNDTYNFDDTDIRGAGFSRKLDKTTGLTGTIDIGAYEWKKRTDPNNIFTWTGTTGTDWATAGNWDVNDVPQPEDIVTIPNAANQPVAGALAVSPGGKLTIESNASVTTSGSVVNNGTIIIRSDINGTGSLITSENATGSGQALVERYMSKNQWHIISSPTGTQTISNFLADNIDIPIVSGTTPTQYGMMDYDPTTDKWNPYFTDATTGTLGIGKGYMVRVEDPVQTLRFQGILNAPTTTNISTGWNCIGNPFTSAIRIIGIGGSNNFIGANASAFESSFGALYFWNQASIKYDVVTLGDLSGFYASVGQGFFMKAKAGATSVIFTPAMQVHRIDAPFKSNEAPIPSIQLMVESGSKKASTDIRFVEGTTKGLDFGYDAGLFTTDKSFALYTKLVEDNGVDFQLQCLPTNQYKDLVIPIGIDSKAGGEIVLSVQTVQLDPNCKVILEDKLTHTFTDLSKGNYKAAVLANSSTSERFFLHTDDIISGLKDQVLPDGNVTAYAKGNKEIRVIGEIGEGAVATLVNGLGQVLLTKKLSAGNLNIIGVPNLSSGVYLLNIIDKGTPQTIKIMIRK